ncbi:uncharacterized protein LOC111314184 isoform X2 [Durio zibethinus]|uniref:Uncharacterized protein LOC111314184 isoform X2 n=1 Tax=Durio zibethinus TaxID=66656 RepID=A0A6P6B1M5_DURZI|nr:uncharacterized protein LOC111314184 isoform X2 [Durio zibethinus]
MKILCLFDNFYHDHNIFTGNQSQLAFLESDDEFSFKLRFGVFYSVNCIKLFDAKWKMWLDFDCNAVESCCYPTVMGASPVLLFPGTTNHYYHIMLMLEDSFEEL